jgi:excisionase family DNA binding protein
MTDAQKKSTRARTQKKPPAKTHRRHSDSRARAVEAVANGELPRLTYRLGEAAAMLGISRWHLDSLIEQGAIGTVMLGTLRVIPATELERLLSSGFERREAQR